MLSKEAVIIIAVCSAITFLLIVLVIYKRYSPSSTPLPTIQPLAHHREHNLEQFQNPIHTPLLEDTSQLSVPNNSTVSLFPTTPPSGPRRSPSNTPHRSRSITTHSTKNSHNRHIIRGVPHGPHSQIQIVLPAPLALYADASSSTLSLADKWASAGIRKQTFHIMSKRQS